MEQYESDRPNQSRPADSRRPRRERFHSEQEFRRLGRILAEAKTLQGVSVHTVAVIRLLLLAGFRRNEFLTLRWKDAILEERELKLADSKTSARTAPFSPEAADVLANNPALRATPGLFSGNSRAGRCAT